MASLESLWKVPSGGYIENDGHGIEKLLIKNSSKLNKFLHSEVNLLIQHIIVEDQDGQNNIMQIAGQVVIGCY